MERIKEVIVVEGKNDSKRLKSFFDVDTIETHGMGLNKETIAFIKEISKKRGVILMLDPDSPGEKIRAKLNEQIPGLKNCFLLKENARTSKKVGVEHAEYEVLKEALDNVVSYDNDKETLSLSEFNKLGLNGLEDSVKKRDIITRHFKIGKCNAKTMFKRLNMLKVNIEDIKKVLGD